MADFRRWIYALAVVALLAGCTIPARAAHSPPFRANAPPGLQAVSDVTANMPQCDLMFPYVIQDVTPIDVLTIVYAAAVTNPQVNSVKLSILAHSVAGSVAQLNQRTWIALNAHSFLGVPQDPPGTEPSRTVSFDLSLTLIENSFLGPVLQVASGGKAFVTDYPSTSWVLPVASADFVTDSAVTPVLFADADNVAVDTEDKVVNVTIIVIYHTSTAHPFPTRAFARRRSSVGLVHFGSQNGGLADANFLV